MEPGDPRSRIRPLPPETPVGAAPHGRPPPPTLRRAVIALAIVVVVGLLVLFGAASTRSGDESDAATTASTTTGPPPIIEAGPAPPTTTTTTTTTTVTPTTRVLEPTLTRLAAPLDNGLVVVVRGDITGVLELWAPADRVPRRFPLTSRPDRGDFDPSGRWLLYETFSGPSAALHVGRLETGQPAVSVGVHGALWHPTQRGRIAWVSQLLTEDSPSIFTGRLITELLNDVEVVAPVPLGSELIAWGDWGFAVRGAVASTANERSLLEVVTIYSPEGEALRTTTGPWLAASSAGVLLFAPLEPAPPFDAPGSVFGDVVVLEGPFAMVDTNLEPIEASFPLFADAGRFLSLDGEWLIQVIPRAAGGVDVRANPLEGGAQRAMPLDDAARPIGFTPDGVYFLLQEEGSNDLVMIDWRRSRVFRIPVDNGSVVSVMTP